MGERITAEDKNPLGRIPEHKPEKIANEVEEMPVGKDHADKLEKIRVATGLDDPNLLGS